MSDGSPTPRGPDQPIDAERSPPDDLPAPLSGGGAVARLPRSPATVSALIQRQSGWVTGSVLTGGLLGLTGTWFAHPELAASLTIAGGLATVDRKRWWSIPVVAAGVVLGGLAAEALSLPAALGAAAVAGALSTRMLGHAADTLDSVHGALAATITTGIALVVTAGSVPTITATSPVLGALIAAALIGLGSAQGMLPAALRSERPNVPTPRQIRAALRPAYRSTAYKAVDLYKAAAARATDPETRHGLGEVTTWVFLLQGAVQTLDDELGAIDRDDVNRRLSRLEADGETTDAFTIERRQATAQHLQRLLQHRVTLEVERGRTDALVHYALAFLEEARASLALARPLPGEDAPDRLPEVLQRLRIDAAAGLARRSAAMEVGARMT